jgi:hypothetical protein
VVENPEGAGEHVEVAPGRPHAPIPSEFSRIVLPSAGDLPALEVWAPRHGFLSTEGGLDGATTAPAFSLGPTKRYFAVLAARSGPTRGRASA